MFFYFRKIINNFKYKKGFSLVESFVAVSIIVVGILAAFNVAIKSLASVSFISDRLVATQLAQEGIEIIDNIRTNNILNGCGWNNGLNDGVYRVDSGYHFSVCSQYLIDYSGYQANPIFLNFSIPGGYGFYSYESGSRSKFNRIIKIRQISLNEIKVNSIVNWSGRGGIGFSLDVEKHLFNYL